MGERGGAAGDLLIVITVRPHKLFKRRDDDLFIELPLTFTQAALGAEIDVPTLGKPVSTDSRRERSRAGVLLTGRACRIFGVMAGRLVCYRRRRDPKKLSDKQKNCCASLKAPAAAASMKRRNRFSTG